MGALRQLRGFTLLELLIGLVIVAILAGMAIPGFSKAIEKTKVKDAQSTLAAIYSSEKIYRLDQTNAAGVATYGTLAQLVANNYISDPDPGGTSNTDWDFSTSGVAATAFTATATRTQAGGGYNGRTITVTNTFNGTNYGGTHTLRDQ